MKTLAAVAFALSIGVDGQRAIIAAPSDWVGANTCKTCHPDQFEEWKRGPHARSRESLGSDRSRVQCLECHATGEAPAGSALFEEVQCESCHGSGSGYAAAEDIMRNPLLRSALGLVDLSTAKTRKVVCRQCHQQELRLRPFESEKGWQRLPHGGAR